MVHVGFNAPQEREHSLFFGGEMVLPSLRLSYSCNDLLPRAIVLSLWPVVTLSPVKAFSFPCMEAPRREKFLPCCVLGVSPNISDSHISLLILFVPLIRWGMCATHECPFWTSTVQPRALARVFCPFLIFQRTLFPTPPRDIGAGENTVNPGNYKTFNYSLLL